MKEKFIKKHFTKIILMIWLCVIWIHSMQPAEISSNESSTVVIFVNHIISFSGLQISEFFLRKLAHFTEFTICGIILSINFVPYINSLNIQIDSFRHFKSKASAISCLLSGILIAMIDETIQMFTPGRSCEVRDVWIDFAGVCLGTILMQIYYHRKNNYLA